MIRRSMHWALVRLSQRAWNVALWASIQAQRFKPPQPNRVTPPRVSVMVRNPGGLN